MAHGSSNYVANADYIIYKVSATYYALNTATTIVDYSGAVFSTVMNAVTTALAATGGSILIKRGTYTLTAQINSNCALTVRGEDRDTTIIRAGANVQLWLHAAGATDKLLSVYDLTLDGARGTGGHTDGAANVQGFKCASSGYFNNVKVINTAQTGIACVVGSGPNLTDPIETFSVVNCFFDNTGSIGGANPHIGPAIRTDTEGATSPPIKNVVITGNRITNANEHGIKFYTTTDTLTPSLVHAYVAGNYIDTVWASGIQCSCSAKIVNNYFNAVGGGHLGGAAILLTYFGNVVVDGNTIAGLIDNSTGVCTWSSHPPTSAIITNNIILSPSLYGILAQGAIQGTIISGNRITQSVAESVFVSSAKTQIKDNIIVNTNASQVGIRINSANNCVVAGNHLEVGYGIQESGTTNYTIVHDNVFICGDGGFTAPPAANDTLHDNYGYP